MFEYEVEFWILVILFEFVDIGYCMESVSEIMDCVFKFLKCS